MARWLNRDYFRSTEQLFLMIVKKMLNQTKESKNNSLKSRRKNWKVSFAFLFAKFRHNLNSKPILNVS